MNKRTECFVIGLVLAALSAALYWVALAPNIETQLWKGASELLKQLSGYAANGAVAFFALCIYVGLKATTEANAHLTSEAFNEIYDCIEPAKNGIEALFRIQNQNPATIAQDGVEPFNNISSFCSRWMQAKRRRRCSPRLQTMLSQANQSLFGFVVALELAPGQRHPSLQNLRDTAIAALEDVERVLSN